MVGLVDRSDGEREVDEVELVDRAGLLLEEPVARERQVQRMHQDHPIDAVMPDEDDRVVAMTGEDVAEHRGDARQHILEGLAAWRLRELRRAIPGRQRIGPARGGLLSRQPLPFAVIDVVEAGQGACRHAG
jgi:hypothetical protein